MDVKKGVVEFEKFMMYCIYLSGLGRYGRTELIQITL